MKVDFVLCTDGSGLWSVDSKNVKIVELDLGYVSDDQDYADFQVRFDVATWNTDVSGLIYTDNLFLRQLKQQLQKMGFSKKSLNYVGYSEQGMQGDDYVSLDCSGDFVKEFISRNTPK